MIQRALALTQQKPKQSRECKKLGTEVVNSFAQTYTTTSKSATTDHSSCRLDIQ